MHVIRANSIFIIQGFRTIVFVFIIIFTTFRPMCPLSALRNLDRTIENDTRKITPVCLLNLKGLAKRTQKICCLFDTGTIFTRGSTLRRYLFRVKQPTEKRDLLPTKSKARRTSKSSSSRRN